MSRAMTDQELRALVRDAVARHLGGRAPEVPAPVPASLSAPASIAGPAGDFSHAVYVTLVNPGDACVIEPGVTCNHCNYCKSHGH
jgi:hypothetical protein